MRKHLLIFFALVFVSGMAWAQERSVSGKVTSKDGSPLPGSAIVVKGTTNGTTTDRDGMFSISVGDGVVLIISSIGYATQEIAVGDRAIIDVILEEDAATLQEVVVSALGIAKDKRSLGYTQETVQGAELVQSNTPNIATALSGRLPGVNITNPNGVDGGTTRIVLGGNNSIQGNNQPLIVVDGMPMSNDVSSSTAGSSNNASSVTAPQDWGSPLNLINAQDIETMNVLKGPAAAALYGTRGANGVILITTKKGTKRPGLGVDYTFGVKVTHPYRYVKMQNEYGSGGMVSLNAPQYQTDPDGNPMLTDGWNQSFVDQKTGTGPYGIDTWNQVSWPGQGVSWGPKMTGESIKWWDGTTHKDLPNPNNIKTLYQNGLQTTHNISLSGGNDLGTIRVSYTRLDNKAILPNSNYNQNTFNVGSSLKISKRLSMQVTASYYNRQYKNAPALGNDDGASWQKRLLYNVGRNYDAYDATHYKKADGSRNPLSGIPWTGNNTYQAWNIFENNTWQWSRKLMSSVQLNYTATDFLDVMLRGSMNNNNNESKTINSPTDVAGVSNALYSHGLTRDNENNFDAIATFHKEKLFNGMINAKLSLGGSSYSRSLYSLSGTTPGTTYVYSNLNYFGNYSGTTQSSQIPQENWYDKKLHSAYGFLNLSYKNFLYVDVTGRNDWSSTLPSNAWSYFFPSVTGSFIFSDAIRLPSFINYGKLRAAWAEAATDTDPYKINIAYAVSSFGGQPTAALPTSLPALNYKPAINKTADFGLSMGFLKNRLTFDVRYFHGRSSNQIMSSPLPQSSGVSSIVVNSGVLENSGIEISLTATPVQTSRLKWDVTFNASHTSNRLLSLANGVNRVDMDNMWANNGVALSAVVGKQFGSIMGYDYVRDSKGRRLLQDESMLTQNGYPTEMKGALYQSTQQFGKQGIIGNSMKKLYGGVTNTLTLSNGLSLSMLVDYRIGGQIWSGTYATMMQQGLAPETLKERNGGGLAYTTPDGTSTKWGVVLPGAYADGTTNTNVVHYYYKYMQYGVWSSGPDNQNWIHSSAVLTDTWVKMREVALSYNIPSAWVQRTKVFQNASVSLVGRDLFYFYSSLPDRINPEGINGAGNAQGIEFASLPGTRSIGFQIRVGL
ncbi:MAG TPA: SusC/RagA family TonB-linked outer membrane protein [Cyclobacteriaceae bacterium]|jgi:iron complex outermembrane receptor protein|nr:SusC/RagA family TonB-linked outer membrane protein [Cyclobacteriaceae bacterium]